MKRILCILGFVLVSFAGQSQTVKLSVYAEVSILTVGPGDELFTAFGHTAIRVKDPLLRLDVVFNYGMFDFNQPNFYLNFAQGKLLYKLGAYRFDRFIQQNNYEKRWVKEQILNLNQEQKQSLFALLTENIKPENASYLYDPFFDNCATRPIALINKVVSDIQWDASFVKNDDTIRKLMNREVSRNSWGSFGINLALGSLIDKQAQRTDYLFLPDYVYLSIQSARTAGKDTGATIVKKENILLDFEERSTSAGLLGPLLLTSLLLLLGVWLTLKDLRRKRISQWFDILVFGTVGLAGIGIIFLWFFTNHATTPYNYHILWCFPLHMVMVFYRKSGKLVNLYWIFSTALIVAIPVVWLSGLQEFTSFVGLIVLVLMRQLNRRYLLTSKM